MRNLAFFLALALALAGCDEPEPTEPRPTDVVLCEMRLLPGVRIFPEIPLDYFSCIHLERSDVWVRDRMAEVYGIKLIDCLRPNGGMVWATREECSEMMGISIDH